MDLGLEHLSGRSVDLASEKAALMEEGIALDYLYCAELMQDSQFNVVYQLITKSQELPAHDRAIVQRFLSEDPTLGRVIQASEEGQKVQDVLRWGIGGLFIGMYLGSFNRILKVLGSNPQLDPSAHSQYLFPENKVSEALGACEKMIAALKTGDANKVLKVYQDLGYKADSTTHTDWAAVGGSILAGVAGSLIAGPLGIVGNILGKNLSEKTRTSAANHGYTPENFKQHCSRICKLIQEIKQMKEVKGTEGAGPFAKKTMKLVCQSVSTIGRGFCAVTA